MATITKSASVETAPYNTVVEAKVSQKSGQAYQLISLSNGEYEPSWGRFSFTPKALLKLFTLDGQGDSNLMNIFGAVFAEVETHEEADRMVKAMLRTVGEFLAWHKDRFDEEESTVIEPTVKTEEPTTPSIPKEELDKFAKWIRTQTRIGRNATAEQLATIAVEAYTFCQGGGTFKEFTTNLAEYTIDEYMAAIS